MARLQPYAAAHAETNGPGDARPTALQIIEDQGLVGGLKGKTVLVTGALSGIGVETARAMAATGADVFVTSRHGKGQDVLESLKKTPGAGKVEHIDLELDSLESVKKAAQDFRSRSKTLNILITNAGIMACPQGKTKDGFELQFGTNHLGHFLLFQLLKDLLLSSATPEFPSRVVVLSSIGHNQSSVKFDDINFEKTEYNPWVAYGSAKTANAWMAREIDRLYGDKGLHSWSLHPGGIWTPLQKHQEEMFDKYKGNEEVEKIIKSTEQGAATTVWAATSKDLLAPGKTGLYLEDCAEAAPKAQGAELGLPGYAPHMYDSDGPVKLWKISNELVGFDDSRL